MFNWESLAQYKNVHGCVCNVVLRMYPQDDAGAPN